MNQEKINQLAYKNADKGIDFEIVGLQDFFLSRPHTMLEKDFRVDFWVIIYITEGRGQHFVDFQPYDYEPGAILFIHKNQVQHFVVNQEVQGYMIHINEPFFYQVDGLKGDLFIDFVDQAYGSPMIAFDTSPQSTNRVLVELIKRNYDQKETPINIPLIATLFRGFILSLRGQISSNEPIFHSKAYEHFKNFRQMVEDHYTESRNVEAYASMMHLSKKTVNQATRQVLGVSAKQYITNRLLLEIKRYLSQGELLTYEIADLLGFGDAANMTKFFKHYVGLSPKEFKVSIEQHLNR